MSLVDAYDRITALLALPSNAPITDIVLAVEKVVRRCEQLEYQVLEVESNTSKSIDDKFKQLDQRIVRLEKGFYDRFRVSRDL